MTASDGYRDDVARLFQMLMDSPGHRANILTEGFTHVGIGIETGAYDPYSGRPTMLATQNFASSSGALDQQILGSGGRDVVRSGSGADHITTRGGDDIVAAGAQADIIYAGSGSDKVHGGDGRDTAYLGRGNDTYADVTEGGWNGRDRVFGGGGNDTIHGGGGNDLLNGGAGRDVLRGQAGNDRLVGGADRDNLDGGAGDDRLVGGVGADTFVFRKGSGTDMIADFADGADRIRIDDALWQGSLSAAEVVENFGVALGSGIALDFGTDRLVFRGINEFDVIVDQFTFF